MRVVGLDVGGANLKVSDGATQAVTLPFPLWEHPKQLGHALSQIFAGLGAFDCLAVTMTGELADCFASKTEGVDAILGTVESVVQVPVMVWQTGGEFMTPAEAREFTTLVAAANWHALATWAGRMVPETTGLLIDMGSTTTDIIPLANGLPDPTGRTDVERLLSGELRYTGSRRTPVCAVLPAVPFQDRLCPLAAETFATMGDVYLILGDVPPDPTDHATADHRPRTREAALQRLARMLCCDASELCEQDLRAIAQALADGQRQQLRQALDLVLTRCPQRPARVLVCGEGEFLVRAVLRDLPRCQRAEVISLTQVLGPEQSQAACAFALARLGAERLC